MIHEFWFWFVIWFIGCIANYFLFKKVLKNIDDDWTIGSRAAVIFVSISSWISVVLVFAIGLNHLFKSDYWNRPAKW